MADRPLPFRLVLAVAVVLGGGGCVLGDLFGSETTEQVTLYYEGPTGNMSPGARAPFLVTVWAGEQLVRNARVSLMMLTGDSVATLSATKDTIIALNIQGAGTDTLYARFESSMLIDSAVTLKQTIRVQGGGP